MAPSYTLAVMGVTGAGKSSFIKLATGDSRIKVGHTQESETKVISSHIVEIHGKTFTLVDTPGFDDTLLTDSDVLEMLVDWLACSYSSGQKLNGILYMHRLTDARMRGSSVKNLKLFKELIGDEFHSNVTLGTSCWSMVPLDLAVERETELKTGTTFWKILLEKGAKMERIPDDDVTKARELIYKIACNEGVTLQVQREIVDLGKTLADLEVANTVDYKLEEMRKNKVEWMRRVEEEQREEAERAAEQQRERELQQRRMRERNLRIQLFQQRQLNCERKVPFGNCDKYGCYNKLKHYTAIFHCCSCRDGDDCWHCGACGNDCGVDEHPAMYRINNEDEECVVM